MAPVALVAAFAVACDAGITARIDTASMVNPHLSAAAVRIARDTDGVHDVSNRILVTRG